MVTKFNTLLWQELKIRIKTIHSIFIIQIIAGILISIWTMSDHVFDNTFWQVDLFVTITWSAAIGLIIYLIISIWQSNKMLQSKTWNLIPMSSSKLYLTHLSSALIGCLYFVILQTLLLLIFMVPLIHHSSDTWMIHLPFIGPYLLSSTSWFDLNFIDYFKILLLVVLILVFIYSISALILITRRTISNFVRPKVKKLTQWVTTIALILIAYYSFNHFLMGLSDILRINFIMRNNLAHSGIGIALLTLIIFNLIFIGIGTWELKNYFEIPDNN